LTHPERRVESSVLSPFPLVPVVVELLLSCEDSTDRSLISEDSEATESRTEEFRDRFDEESPSVMSRALRSTAHPAAAPSWSEIILIPRVWPVVAGMKRVVQPFWRVIAVRCG
jgi:hypothetical protein